MAITPGSLIKRSDLQDLAAVANGKGLLAKKVVPCFLDGSSHPFGHKRFFGVVIDPLHRGTGYGLGENLSLGFGSLYEVVAITGAGEVQGIRVINHGTGQYNDPTWDGVTGTQISNSGGNGTGCQLGYTFFSQYGPTAAYGFADFSVTGGKVTGFIVSAGNAGHGYAVGDLFSFAELPGAQLHADTVSSIGAVLTVSVVSLPPATEMPATVLSMPAVGGAGTGLKCGALFIMNQNPLWQTELNRLRSDVTDYFGNLNAAERFSKEKMCVSGPWPVDGPTANFEDTWFWFADTGKQESVTISSGFPGARGTFATINVESLYKQKWLGDAWWTSRYDSSNDPGYSIGQTIQEMDSPFPVTYKYSTVVGRVEANGYVVYSIRPNDSVRHTHIDIFATEANYTMIVGGDRAVHIKGDFILEGAVVRGRSRTTHQHGDPSDAGWVSTDTGYTTDASDPGGLVEVRGNFPGSPVKSTMISGSLEYLVITFSVDEDVSPGTYTIELIITNEPFDTVERTESHPVTAYTDGTQYPYIPGLPYLDNLSWDLIQVETYHTRVNFVRTAWGGGGNELYGRTITASLIYNAAENANGVHGTKALKKIHLPGDAGAHGPMIYGVYTFPTNGGAPPVPEGTCYQLEPYPQPIFGPLQYSSFTPIISTTTPGFWTAKCEMISSLRMVPPSGMPWNLARTKYGAGGVAYVNPMLRGDFAPNITNDFGQSTGQVSGSYDQSLPVEYQIEPPSWAPKRYFPAGFCIQDGNGNLQIVGAAGTSGLVAPGWAGAEGAITYDGGPPLPGMGTLGWKCYRVLAAAVGSTWLSATGKNVGESITDPNGRTQVVTKAGTTGSVQPIWGVAVGSKTTDGTVIWEARVPVSPAVHRPKSVGRYPVYWASETLARLKPPTATSGLTVLGSYNQWVEQYSSQYDDQGWQSNPRHVSAENPTGGMAYGWWIYSVSINRCASGVGGVMVTIGCIRNGAFVAFGSWSTGQTIQVLWPVFTSDALVYQCSERVDIQAAAIEGAVDVSGRAASYPPCAAHLNDPLALMALMP